MCSGSGRPSRTLDITSVILGGEYLTSGVSNCLVIPKQFHELREVGLSREHILNPTLVEMEAVGSELKAILAQSPFQVGQKSHCCFLGALTDLKARHQLCLRIERDEHPLIPDFGRVVFADSPRLFPDEAPNLIALQVVRAQIADVFERMFGAHRCREHQRQDRAFVQSSDAGNGANTHSLKHQRQRLCCGFRRSVVRSKFKGGRIGKRGAAGLATVTLDFALAVNSELLSTLVLASYAGHGFSPLDFCGEKPQNLFGSRLRLTPRFGLAPTPVSAE